MVAPLRGLAFRGVVWYQGESNYNEASRYACLFPQMISAWRRHFSLPNLTFLFVQVSTWLNAFIPISQIRTAQLSALQLNNTGVAYAYDIGDIASPYNNIHPRNKQTLGARLSSVANSIAYGQPGNTDHMYYKKKKKQTVSTHSTTQAVNIVL